MGYLNAIPSEVWGTLIPVAIAIVYKYGKKFFFWNATRIERKADIAVARKEEVINALLDCQFTNTDDLKLVINALIDLGVPAERFWDKLTLYMEQEATHKLAKVRKFVRAEALRSPKVFSMLNRELKKSKDFSVEAVPIAVSIAQKK